MSSSDLNSYNNNKETAQKNTKDSTDRKTQKNNHNARPSQPSNQANPQHKRLSLNEYLTRISLVVSIGIGLFLILFFNNRLSTLVRQENEADATSAFSQTVSLIEQSLNQSVNVLNNLENNEFIISTLEVINDTEEESTQRYNATQQIINYLFVLTQESQLVQDILVVTDYNQFSASINVADFQLNGIRKREGIPREQLFYGESFYLNSQYSEGIPAVQRQEETSSYDSDYFQDKLYFATNIVSQSDSHIGTAFVILDTAALDDLMLTPEQYEIRYDSYILMQGEEVTNSSDALILEQEIMPYGLEVINQPILYSNPGLQYLFIYILLILFIVLILSLPFSRYLAKNALKSLDQLLAWMGNQGPGKTQTEIKPTVNFSLNLRDRIFAYLSLTIMLPLLVIMVLYFFQFSYSFEQDVETFQSIRTESKSQLINNEINKLQRLLASLSINELPIQETIDTDANLNRYLSNYQSNLNVLSISLLDDAEELYGIRSDEIYEINDSNLITRSSNGDFQYIFFEYDNQPYAFIRLPVTNINPNFEEVDTVQIEFNANFFASLPLLEEAVYEQVVVNGEPIFRFTADNQVTPAVYRRNNRSNGDNNVDFSQAQIPLFMHGWTYDAYFDNSYIRQEVQEVFLKNSYIFFILILFILALSYWITYNILKPFNAMIRNQNALVNVSNQKSLLSGVDEITQIRQNFSETLDQLNQQIAETIDIQENLIKEKYEKREIQLLALQNQINPHFLYNALDNLLFLVEDEQTEAAMRMIHSLSNYFQFINNRKDLIIPLWREIEFTRHYLSIMKFRFDNFEVAWDVDHELMSRPLIKLILQPLVENVVHHGVRNTDRLVHLQISIQAQGDEMWIVVADDADGMTNDQLEQIRYYQQNQTFNRSGLSNVYDRLSLYYEDSMSFEITSELNKGTTVTIKIPSFVKQL